MAIEDKVAFARLVRREGLNDRGSHRAGNRYGGFSVIEVLVVIVLLTILATFAGQRLTDRQRGAAIGACANQLRDTGRMLAQYQSESMFDAMPLAGTHRAYDSDAATLDPYICFWKAGLLIDSAPLICPVGGGPIVFGEGNPNSVAVLGDLAVVGTRGAVRIQSGTQAASNYLFTWYYRKENAPNRVIAGDAAGATSATGATAEAINAETGRGYSPNHGDTAERRVGGANALFADGRVESSGADYVLPRAQPRSGEKRAGNLWDRFFAPISGGTSEELPVRDGVGSVIGGY